MPEGSFEVRQSYLQTRMIECFFQNSYSYKVKIRRFVGWSCQACCCALICPILLFYFSPLSGFWCDTLLNRALRERVSERVLFWWPFTNTLTHIRSTREHQAALHILPIRLHSAVKISGCLLVCVSHRSMPVFWLVQVQLLHNDRNYALQKTLSLICIMAYCH